MYYGTVCIFFTCQILSIVFFFLLYCNTFQAWCKLLKVSHSKNYQFVIWTDYLISWPYSILYWIRGTTRQQYSVPTYWTCWSCPFLETKQSRRRKGLNIVTKYMFDWCFGKFNNLEGINQWCFMGLGQVSLQRRRCARTGGGGSTSPCGRCYWSRARNLPVLRTLSQATLE